MATWFKEAAALAGLFVAALAVFALVPVAAPALGLDPAAPHVQLGLFLALWAPALILAVQALGLIETSARAYLVALAASELLAASALVSTRAFLVVVWVLAGGLWWLARRLGIHPGAREP